MKYIYFSFLLFSFSSCSKSLDCGTVEAKCLEQPPTNEACTAYFSRWFYSSSSNTCELKSYSGCEMYGFETKEECDQCACKK